MLLTRREEEEASKELNLLVCHHKYSNFAILLIFSMENILNSQSFGLNFMREIKCFISIQKTKNFQENSAEFKHFLIKYAFRIEKYLENLLIHKEKSLFSIYFFFNALKLAMPNHLPFYQLPEPLSHSTRQILSKINEPINEDLKLFSNSKPCFLSLGASFSYKGLIFCSSLECDLAYFLSSFVDFQCNYYFFFF